MDYWDLDEILASQTELKTSDQEMPFYVVERLLDQVQLQIPSFFQRQEFESNSYLNLFAMHPHFFHFTKLLLMRMYILY
jgi:hypothetical protein